ncbi:FecCD family ABC transporter permease [Candidatus Nitrotoga sp. 1052]|uniref:FecCD family ABC transporter permease n=1 Tax=Candidatus Nitrotoga sp. 1052 TaxID=2886964 RepID=UPI001F96B77A|nr:iron ABC transporter permease [Candidatus Nitrotoga sp. 1052]CAH1088067.1 Iron complex transport system permease protein [Candidatus Nitrotoga sp. 1052]
MPPRVLFFLLICSVPLSLGFGLMNGSLPLAPIEVWYALLGNNEDTATEVLWQLRLPRVLAAFVCGGLLALSGVLLQALLRNPLADPYILGISGGAAVGALAAMLLGAGLATTQLSSFTGASLAIVAVFGLGFRHGERNIYRLLLTGVVLSAGCGALISLLLTLAQGEQVKGMLFWLMGDLSHSQGLPFAWFVLLAVGLCATVLSGGLDVLAGGLDKAAALGVAVGRWQAGLYFAAAVLTVTALQLGGSIGFVGLMIPHAIRLLGVSAHRWLIPSSTLLGGSFLVLADTLARMVWSPMQLPVGILTALLGVPVLLWLLSRRS